MTDRRIDQAHDDLSAILRPSLFDGRTEPLYVHAHRRIVLATDDGLGAVDYSRDPISGSRGAGRPHSGRNELLDQWTEAVRLVASAPRHPDTVAMRAAKAANVVEAALRHRSFSGGSHGIDGDGQFHPRCASTPKPRSPSGVRAAALTARAVRPVRRTAVSVGD